MTSAGAAPFGAFCSSWPLDHGDNMRQKCTLQPTWGLPSPENGLPGRDAAMRAMGHAAAVGRGGAGGDDGALTAEDAFRVLPCEDERIFNVQWMYTRTDREIFVYGGRAPTPYVALLDAKTLRVRQYWTLPPSAYFGGGAMHANGHFYLVHWHSLYVFRKCEEDGSFKRVRQDLPAMRNPFNFCNGMMVLPNGQILLKQWCLQPYDAYMMGAYQPVVLLLVLAVGLYSAYRAFCFLTGLAMVQACPLLVQQVAAAVLVPALLLFVIFVSTPTCVVILYYIMFTAVFKPELGETTLLPAMLALLTTPRHRQSRLLVVDPHADGTGWDLQHRQWLPERACFPRLCLDGHTLMVLGDFHCMIFDITQWPAREVYRFRYRSWLCGEFSGTGPMMRTRVEDAKTGRGMRVFTFTNNTFPAIVDLGFYRVWTVEMPFDAKHPERVDAAGTVVHEQRMARGGWMFWSVIRCDDVPEGQEERAAEFSNDYFVWDIQHHRVQRRSGTHQVRWQVDELFHSDCGFFHRANHQIYAVDYEASDLMHFPFSGQYFTSCAHTMHGRGPVPRMKYAVVLDSRTGEEQTRIPVGQVDTTFPTMLIPGMNQDLFVGGSWGIRRVLVNRSKQLETRT